MFVAESTGLSRSEPLCSFSMSGLRDGERMEGLGETIELPSFAKPRDGGRSDPASWLQTRADKVSPERNVPRTNGRTHCDAGVRCDAWAVRGRSWLRFCMRRRSDSESS